MGNASIDYELKNEIEELLKKKENRIVYQNFKGFVDKACLNEIKRIKDA